MKDNIDIYITTRGRPGRQVTLENIPKSLLPYVSLVVDKTEYYSHKKKYSEKVAIICFSKGTGTGGLSEKRQFCLEHTSKKYLVLLDDDLRFYTRDKDRKLIIAKEKDIKKMFDLLFVWMEKGYAHVGVSPREGNNWVTEDYIKVGRMMRVLCFNVEVLRKEKIRFDRLLLMSDFDVVLSLLEKGYPNIVSFIYANGHRGSNDKGGCSFYRTPELMEKSAKKLKKLHPKILKVITKETKKPWMGFNTKKRIDVNISWKSAYSLGKKLKDSRKKNIIDFLI